MDFRAGTIPDGDAAPSSPPLRLWLIEGVPGAGKTTAAQAVCAMAETRGWPARWWLEEAAEHPVTPAALRRRAGEPGFSDLCVTSFAGFVARERGVAVLEGCAFQSVVRFMFANGWPAARIGEHVARWEAAVAPGAPRLAILQVDDVERHLQGFVARARGPVWIAKVSAYVARTPLAVASGWSGTDGLVRFWAGYQALMLALAADMAGPVRVLEAAPERGQGVVADMLRFFSDEC